MLYEAKIVFFRIYNFIINRWIVGATHL